MKEIINAIFVQSGFSQSAEIENCVFFENSHDQQQSYFLVHFLPINNVVNYLNSNLFERALAFFEEQKKLKPDIEKNTSLIIVTRAEFLERDFLNYKNGILEVEEDEFWFKKYVLVYSDTAIANINQEREELDQFKSFVLDTAKFTNFKENMFSDPEYFISMQIFLKLPFLNVPIALREEYLSIDSIIQNNLSKGQISYMDLIDKEMENMSEPNWSQLKTDSIGLADSEHLKTFFSKFYIDDQNTQNIPEEL